MREWVIETKDGLYATTEGTCGDRYVYRAGSINDALKFPTVAAALDFIREHADHNWCDQWPIALVEVQARGGFDITRRIA